MPSLLAFLHHVAAFALVGALAVEFALIRAELTLASARALQRADMVLGASAFAVLVVGLGRVFHFEKGAGYYFNDGPFLIKLALFIVVGLASIYPTMQFLSWRGSTAAGHAPAVPAATLRTLRRLIHWEIGAVVVILLCAALMADGVGFFGATR